MIFSDFGVKCFEPCNKSGSFRYFFARSHISLLSFVHFIKCSSVSFDPLQANTIKGNVHHKCSSRVIIADNFSLIT
jgi:hypothetical protein